MVTVLSHNMLRHYRPLLSTIGVIFYSVQDICVLQQSRLYEHTVMRGLTRQHMRLCFYIYNLESRCCTATTFDRLLTCHMEIPLMAYLLLSSNWRTP
jgi:hypothetical protein